MLMRKKILAGILSLAMVFSMMPTTGVLAEETDNATQAETETKMETTSIPPVTSDSYYINSGGTYTLQGGDYTTDQAAIIINTTDDVTLNIGGDITTSTNNSFILVTTACSNLTINGKDYTIKNTSTDGFVLTNPGAANVTITGGIFKTGFSSTIVNRNGGTINVNGGKISSEEFAISNFDSYVNINGGEVTGAYGGVWNGTVVMTGGTITDSIYSIVLPDSATITGGIIKNSVHGIELNSVYGVELNENSNVTIGGSTTFTNNMADVYLGDRARVTISDDFTGTVSVGVEGTISDHTKRQITTAGTAERMLAKVSSVDNAYEVNYDADGKYLYLWKHAHTWSYTADGNTITARCTSDSDCPYSEGRTLTLTAPDMTYTGSAYDQASVTDYISGVSDETAGEITYYKTDTANTTDGGTLLSSAPTELGYYYAAVTIGGATATANFAITKRPVTVQVSMEGWTYGDTAKTPHITDDSNPGNGKVTYTYYKDKECTARTTSADGAAADGAVPENAGTYYVRAEVAETDNYAAGSGVASFTIAPKQNSGTITIGVIVSAGMTKMEVKNQNLTAEAVKALLTEEEQAQVNAGAEVAIHLEANDLEERAVSTEDRNCVEGQLDRIVETLIQSEGLTSKKEVATGIHYMDLSLYKKVGSATATKLKTIGENALEITVGIPDDLKSDNSKRTYYVIRVHETDAGTEAQILPTTKSGDTLTFTTDRFSTYAIVYAESGGVVTPTVPSDGNSADTGDTGDTSGTPDSKDQSDLSDSAESKQKLPLLLAKGKGGDKKIVLSWASCEGADGYDCYWSYCDGNRNFKKFVEVKASEYHVTHKNLKNNGQYKYFVAAYKMVDGEKVYMAKSKQLHVATKNAKKTNAQKVTVNKTDVTLKAGETFVVRSSTKLENADKKPLLHVREYRYDTSDETVAYVSGNGKVTAVKPGTCVIYVLANNGVYSKITITVE